MVGAAITFAARAAGVPGELLASLAYHVSGYNPTAAAGGRLGLFMLTPATAGLAGVDPLNPATAAGAAARFLRSGHDSCRGSWAHALAAYAWDQQRGPALVRANMEPDSWPADVRAFVGRVLSGAGIALPVDMPVIVVARGGR